MLASHLFINIICIYNVSLTFSIPYAIVVIFILIICFTKYTFLWSIREHYTCDNTGPRQPVFKLLLCMQL